MLTKNQTEHYGHNQPTCDYRSFIPVQILDPGPLMYLHIPIRFATPIAIDTYYALFVFMGRG